LAYKSPDHIWKVF